jgi:hypothetical protein
MTRLEDYLLLVNETFLTAENEYGETLLLRSDVWNTKEQYRLQKDSSWQEVTGWFYLFCESGVNNLTENTWSGAYDTEQEAFNDAFMYFGPQDDLSPEEDEMWQSYADEHGLTLDL